MKVLTDDLKSELGARNYAKGYMWGSGRYKNVEPFIIDNVWFLIGRDMAITHKNASRGNVRAFITGMIATGGGILLARMLGV